MEVNVDLDSLQRDGGKVTYRAEFKSQRNGKLRRNISIAVIDCEKAQRKGLETEQFLADGSIQRGSIDYGWKTIQPGSITDTIRRLICTYHPR